MKGKTKRKFTADFKLKVVLEVLKEKDTSALITKRHELHPNQISDWENQFLEVATTLFESAHKASPPATEPNVALLYEQIGRLQMALAFLRGCLSFCFTNFAGHDSYHCPIDKSL